MEFPQTLSQKPSNHTFFFHHKFKNPTQCSKPLRRNSKDYGPKWRRKNQTKPKQIATNIAALAIAPPHPICIISPQLPHFRHGSTRIPPFCRLQRNRNLNIQTELMEWWLISGRTSSTWWQSRFTGCRSLWKQKVEEIRNGKGWLSYLIASAPVLALHNNFTTYHRNLF